MDNVQYVKAGDSEWLCSARRVFWNPGDYNKIAIIGSICKYCQYKQ